MKIFFGIGLAFISAPLILIVIISLKNKQDDTNVIKYSKAAHIAMIFIWSVFSIFSICSFIPGLIEGEVIMLRVVCFTVLILASIAVLKVFLYKVEVFDNHFVYRTMFGRKKIYKYEEITNLKWSKHNKYYSLFRICIGRKKIEMAETSNNFQKMYKKLKEHGIIKKFPKTDKLSTKK